MYSKRIYINIGSEKDYYKRKEFCGKEHERVGFSVMHKHNHVSVRVYCFVLYDSMGRKL